MRPAIPFIGCQLCRAEEFRGAVWWSGGWSARQSGGSGAMLEADSGPAARPSPGARPPRLAAAALGIRDPRHHYRPGPARPSNKGAGELGSGGMYVSAERPWAWERLWRHAGPGPRPASSFAVLCVALAIAARLALGLLAPDVVLFTTLFPAVLTATLVGGAGPGLQALALGGLAAWYFVLPPRLTSPASRPSDAVSLALYALSSASSSSSRPRCGAPEAGQVGRGRARRERGAAPAGAGGGRHRRLGLGPGRRPGPLVGGAGAPVRPRPCGRGAGPRGFHGLHPPDDRGRVDAACARRSPAGPPTTSSSASGARTGRSGGCGRGGLLRDAGSRPSGSPRQHGRHGAQGGRGAAAAAAAELAHRVKNTLAVVQGSRPHALSDDRTLAEAREVMAQAATARSPRRTRC